jgi:hypothetical protein
MRKMVERAEHAASQVCGPVSSGRHVETLPTGEEVFRVGVVGHEREATVTLNPNGQHAGVEWQDGYRIFRLHGLVEG